MSIWYIKEYDRQNSIIKKIKNIFNIIEIENADGKIFCKLPIDEKTDEKKTKVLAQKLNVELYKNCIENVVLSQGLQKIEAFKNELYRENVNILDGRKLFQILILDILKYICVNQEKLIEEMQISILVNDNMDLNIETILEIAKNAKRLNIVTNNLKKFKHIEEYLYNELRSNG